MNSIAFVADAMVVIDIAWTVAGKAGPNAHHLETALASDADQMGNRIASVAPATEETCRNLNATATMASANDTTDIWAPYKATGLKLKVFAEVSPDTGNGSVARRSYAEGRREARESPATTPVPDEETHLGDGKRTSHLESLGGGILGALNKGDDTSDRRPRSFPNTKETRKERERDAHDVVVDGFLRTRRHQRAESDGPPRRSFGDARSRKTAAATHGCGSGRVSDKLLKRSRTEIGVSAINDQAGSGGGRQRVKEPENSVEKLFHAREGSGEADGIWAGRRVSMVEEGEGGGTVGEEVGGRTGGKEGGRKRSGLLSPLSIRVEDNDGPVDDLFGIARAPRVAEVGSSGPASCPTRPSGYSGERGEGRDTLSVNHVQVLSALPVIPPYSGLQKSCLLCPRRNFDNRSVKRPPESRESDGHTMWFRSFPYILSMIMLVLTMCTSLSVDGSQLVHTPNRPLCLTRVVYLPHCRGKNQAIFSAKDSGSPCVSSSSSGLCHFPPLPRPPPTATPVRRSSGKTTKRWRRKARQTMLVLPPRSGLPRIRIVPPHQG